MRTRTLHVTLDTTKTPPVTVAEGNLSLGQHRFSLNWIPADGQSGWTFSQITQGDKTSPLGDPPFTNVTVTDGQISVEDDNKHAGDHGTFSYSIAVKSGGSTYWSDPEIINRGGN
jgi:hypothetical protein